MATEREGADTTRDCRYHCLVNGHERIIAFAPHRASQGLPGLAHIGWTVNGWRLAETKYESRSTSYIQKGMHGEWQMQLLAWPG